MICAAIVEEQYGVLTVNLQSIRECPV